MPPAAGVRNPNTGSESETGLAHLAPVLESLAGVAGGRTVALSLLGEAHVPALQLAPRGGLGAPPSDARPKRLWIGAFVVGGGVALGACNSPTAPGRCDDPHGRTPVPYLEMTCTPIGSDLQCQVIRYETGYCADPAPRDLTRQAWWVSSDQSIARFDAPGHLQALSAGEVHIHAETLAEPFLKSDEQAYIVSPGRQPERLAWVGVGVRDGSTGAFIANATVDLVAQRGAPQTCYTDQFGQCRFWTFVTPSTIRVSKAGYAGAETSVTPHADCHCLGTLISLSPLDSAAR